MENTDNRAALGRDSGNDSQRRMRPSLYYDESEMTLSPNSISGTPSNFFHTFLNQDPNFKRRNFHDYNQS